MTSVRDFARATSKFRKFGIFADWGTTDTKSWNGTIRSISLSGGIQKIGCVILMRISGPTGVRPKTSVTLAGRMIGYSNVSVKTRKVCVTERTGLGWLSGIAGTEVTIELDRFIGKTMITRSKRIFVPTLKFLFNRSNR